MIHIESSLSGISCDSWVDRLLCNICTSRITPTEPLLVIYVSDLCANDCYTLGKFHLPTRISSDFRFFFIYYLILYNCYITVFTTFKMSVGCIFSIMLLISVKGGAIVIHSWSNLCVKVGFVFLIFCCYLQVCTSTVGLQYCWFLI